MSYADQVNSYVDVLNRLTLPAIDKNKLYDTFFDNSPLWQLLYNENNVDNVKGGLFIQEQFNTGKSQNAGWYTGAQSWTVSEYNGIIDGGWNWCFAADHVMVTGQELTINNESNAAIVDLVQGRVDVSKLSLPDLISTSAYINNPYGTNSDHSTGVPYAPEGLAVLVDDGTISSTVGRISRSSFPTLKAQVNYNMTQSGTFLSNLQTLYTNAWKGNSSRPNIITSSLSNFNYFAGLLQTNERYYLSPASLQAMGYKNTGGANLAFNDAPWFPDTKCPTGVVSPATGSGSGGYIYMLDSKTFKLKIHPDRDFAISSWYRDISSDTFMLDVLFAGSLINTDPRRNAAAWVSGG